MKWVALFVYGPLWPVAMGSQLVIVEMARSISLLPGVSLKVVTIGLMNCKSAVSSILKSNEL